MRSSEQGHTTPSSESHPESQLTPAEGPWRTPSLDFDCRESVTDWLGRFSRLNGAGRAPREMMEGLITKDWPLGSLREPNISTSSLRSSLRWKTIQGVNKRRRGDTMMAPAHRLSAGAGSFENCTVVIVMSSWSSLEAELDL